MYAAAVLYAFVACIGLRMLLVLGGGLGLWISSRRPLGGLTGHRFDRKQPSTPRRPRSSLPAHDPSTRSSPRKTWQAAENEFDWAWRERTRARIQDAFELCMVRRSGSRASDPLWAARSATALPLSTTTRILGSSTFTARQAASDSAGKTAKHPPSTAGLLPQLTPHGATPVTPPPISRGKSALTDATNSTQDVFYTPASESFSNVTEFGMRRHSHESDESVADDSTALLSEGHSRENSSSSRSHSSSRRQSNMTGGALARVRSTSVSLLRESISQGLVKRARSGTMKSSDSRYTEIIEGDQYRGLILKWLLDIG